MKLTISGDVPSKKNSKQIQIIHGRPMFFTSSQHRKWHKQALPQLFGKSPAQHIEAVELILYPSTRRAADLTNKAESVMDLLVDGKIISDDNWFVVPKVNLQFGGVDKLNPRCEITIHER